jgi:hypothetical protein
MDSCVWSFATPLGLAAVYPFLGNQDQDYPLLARASRLVVRRVAAKW